MTLLRRHKPGHRKPSQEVKSNELGFGNLQPTAGSPVPRQSGAGAQAKVLCYLAGLPGWEVCIITTQAPASPTGSGMVLLLSQLQRPPPRWLREPRRTSPWGRRPKHCRQRPGRLHPHPGSPNAAAPRTASVGARGGETEEAVIRDSSTHTGIPLGGVFPTHQHPGVPKGTVCSP